MRRCPVQFFEAGSVIELAHLHSFEVAELYNGPVWRRTLRTFNHLREARDFKVVAVPIFQSSYIKLLGPSAIIADGIELILFKHTSKRRSIHSRSHLRYFEVAPLVKRSAFNRATFSRSASFAFSFSDRFCLVFWVWLNRFSALAIGPIFWVLPM